MKWKICGGVDMRRIIWRINGAKDCICSLIMMESQPVRTAQMYYFLLCLLFSSENKKTFQLPSLVSPFLPLILSLCDSYCVCPDELLNKNNPSLMAVERIPSSNQGEHSKPPTAPQLLGKWYQNGSIANCRFLHYK